MPLETGTYISDLVAANPTTTDGLNQGDDHLRLLKSVLKATFPNITGAVSSTQAELDAAVAATGSSGALALAPGTAAAPTYSFTGDASGWYASAAHELSLSLNGVQAAKWNATGLDLLTHALNLSDAANLTVAGSAVFPLQSANIGASQVLTAAIANSNVTYGKIQNVTDQKLLGNFSGAAAAPAEYGIGTGLLLSGTNLTAPAFPPAGAFKNLAIKVLTNTTVSCIADFVTVTDGTNFKTLPFSKTINLATTGAGALDTGAIASDTWYAIWCIAKADGTYNAFGLHL
jgi:hypothetical protein